MKKTRVCSFLLAILMALSLLPVPSLAANNDSNTTVKIVSFADGRNTDLRDSELLVAKVEGYSGDVTKLIYKWTYTPSLPANTSPWPHLYIFNSQNMTNTKSATINSGSKQGVGYMYAPCPPTPAASARQVPLSRSRFTMGVRFCAMPPTAALSTAIWNWI